MKRRQDGQPDASAAKQNHKRHRSARIVQDPSHVIQPGDSGIWVTCEMGKEARCVTELRALFEEHFDRLFRDTTDGDAKSSTIDAIEDAIEKELDGLRDTQSKPFRSVKLTDQCLLFFKTSPAQVNPADFVLSFCQDIASNPGRKRAHAVKRLTPVTLVGKATEADIDELATTVLAPHFHIDGSRERKFAIRVNTRNNQTIKRDTLIRQVASIVGPGHRVDLGNPDVVILVEIYKNLCGMSVVSNEYEKLKRYNLAEIKAAEPVELNTVLSGDGEPLKVEKPT